MNGKKPNTEEKAWMDAIVQLGCIVCKEYLYVFSPGEVHHTNGGDNHLDTICLCVWHHRAGACTDQYVSRHPYKKAFEQRYGSEKELLEKTKRLVNDRI